MSLPQLVRAAEDRFSYRKLVHTASPHTPDSRVRYTNIGIYANLNFINSHTIFNIPGTKLLCVTYTLCWTVQFGVCSAMQQSNKISVILIFTVWQFDVSDSAPFSRHPSVRVEALQQRTNFLTFWLKNRHFNALILSSGMAQNSSIRRSKLIKFSGE